MVHVFGCASIHLGVTAHGLGQSFVLPDSTGGADLAEVETPNTQSQIWQQSHPTRRNYMFLRTKGSTLADWLFIAGYVALVSWMMFASFNSSGGKLKIAGPEVQRFRA